MPIDHNRSVSGPDNSKWEHFKKATTSPQTNIDKNVINSYEKHNTTMKR